MDVDRAPLSRLPLLAAVTIPTAFLAVFFVYPLVTIVARGLGERGSGAFQAAETLRIAWFTTWQAALSTLLTLVVGLPLAWVVGRFAFRGRQLVLALVLVPFVLPTLVVATAFVSLLPDRLDQSVWAILLAHAFFNVAVVVRVVGGYWAGLGRTTEAAAAVLGAGPWQRLREVTLPQLAPALAAASALTFLFSFTSFGVIVVLGGPTIATLETEIYNQAARLFDLRTAAVLALVQLVAVAAIILVCRSTRGETCRPRRTCERVADVAAPARVANARQSRRSSPRRAFCSDCPSSRSCAARSRRRTGSASTTTARSGGRRASSSSRRGRRSPTRSRSRRSQPRSRSGSAVSLRLRSPGSERAGSTRSSCCRSAARP